MVGKTWKEKVKYKLVELTSSKIYVNENSCEDVYVKQWRRIKLDSDRQRLLLFCPHTGYSGTRQVLEYLGKFFHEQYQVILVSYNQYDQLMLDNADWQVHIFPDHDKTDLGKLKLIVKSLQNYCNFEIICVNYVIYSEIFDLFDESVIKILVTHDILAGMNERKKVIGITNNEKFQINEKDEIHGWLKADLIISLQAKESTKIKKLTDNQVRAMTLSPLLCMEEMISRHEYHDKLQVGYFASDYANNLRALQNLLEKFEDDIWQHIDLVIGGRICRILSDNLSEETCEKLIISGEFDDVKDFYCQVDIVVNPDQFESGLKMKNVEAICYGIPLLSTTESNVGIDSEYKWHNCESVMVMIDYLKEIANKLELLAELAQASENTRLLLQKRLINQERKLKKWLAFK